ncbi:hypothetical protein GIB67_041462, partial [Kingdonia uniflora]
VFEGSNSGFGPPDEKASCETDTILSDTNSAVSVRAARTSPEDVPASRSLELQSMDHTPSSSTQKSKKPVSAFPRRTVGGAPLVAIQKLETAKTDLKSKIAKKAKENEVLHESLERLKQTLHEQRLALQEDVTRLKKQLQRERDLKETMEAGLNTTLRNLRISDNIDEKTKTELEEIAQTEIDVTNLKQKVAELHMHLNQQRKNEYGTVCESCGQLQQNSPILKKENLSKVLDLSKDYPLEYLTRADYEKVKIQDPPLLPKIRITAKQPQDSVHDSTNKIIGAATLSSLEPVTVGATALSNAKKSGLKIEGTVTTSSALSKLTNRLNFLKERRSQIVNELQNMENGRPSEI